MLPVCFARRLTKQLRMGHQAQRCGCRHMKAYSGRMRMCLMDFHACMCCWQELGLERSRTACIHSCIHRESQPTQALTTAPLQAFMLAPSSALASTLLASTCTFTCTLAFLPAPAAWPGRDDGHRIPSRDRLRTQSPFDMHARKAGCAGLKQMAAVLCCANASERRRNTVSCNALNAHLRVMQETYSRLILLLSVSASRCPFREDGIRCLSNKNVHSADPVCMTPTCMCSLGH